jgi:hypothetical protein
MRPEKAEARQIIREWQERFWNMPWMELDAWGKQAEEVVSPSGSRFRVETSVFWDMKEWASGMNCTIKVRPKTGWRRWWAYSGWAARGSPDDPVPDPLPGRTTK